MKGDNMIKEKILAVMQEPKYQPTDLDSILAATKIEDYAEFTSVLKDAVSKGEILQSKKGRYGLPVHFGYIRGRVIGNSKGFAFLNVEEAERDYFIPASKMGTALHGDIVLAKEVSASGSRKLEVEVTKVLERNTQTLVGTFAKQKQYGFVIPSNGRYAKDIYVSAAHFLGAENGDKVVLEIISFPTENSGPEGKIIEVLGKTGDRGVDILTIVRELNIQDEFPQAVLQEAAIIPEKIVYLELDQRKDLRKQLMMTIDGEDTKDIDDAISLSLLANGNYQLGVHIADVSYYVKEETPLDKEAFARATSVYLVDRVIPMLPPKLSNGICSLNAGEDRYAMSCIMELDQIGKLIAYELTPSLIHVDFRMTYSKVTKILAKDQELIHEYESLVTIISLMQDLAMLLRKKRLQRGSIDFNIPESKVELDSQGRAIQIIPRTRTVADQIIEEFMLIANETVAEHFFWQEIPGLYRVHEEPKAEKIENLRTLLAVFGLQLNKGSNGPKPSDYQVLIEKMQGTTQEKTLSTIMLRSLQHARYSEENLGHFGLAAKYYCHFTSPIRRYPDLIVHRMLRLVANGKEIKLSQRAELEEKMQRFARQSSLQEKIAETAERDSVDLKKAEYMLQFINTEFSGVVSGITSFGMYVELENSVEGLVRLASLTDDEYDYIQEKMQLIGRKNKRCYTIGTVVKIKVTGANVEAKQRDFELVGMPLIKKNIMPKKKYVENSQPRQKKLKIEHGKTKSMSGTRKKHK